MKCLIVALIFFVLFLYVTMKSFQVSLQPKLRVPMYEKSIRRFLEQLNSDRETVRDERSAASDHSKRHAFHFSNNILHPLILRRLVKRSHQLQPNDEFLLNDEVYFGLEPENKRNDRPISPRRLRLDSILQGGFYG